MHLVSKCLIDALTCADSVDQTNILNDLEYISQLSFLGILQLRQESSPLDWLTQGNFFAEVSKMTACFDHEIRGSGRPNCARTEHIYGMSMKAKETGAAKIVFGKEIAIILGSVINAH